MNRQLRLVRPMPARRLVVVAIMLAFHVELYAQDKSDEPKPKSKSFSVELVDAAGKPVEGASVGIMGAVGGEEVRRYADKDKTDWYYFKHARSGADGLARCVDDGEYLKRLCLIARHEGRKIAAVASIDSDQLEEPVKMTLVPEREVVGVATCKELAELGRVIVYVSYGGKIMLECRFDSVAFRLPLPPGEFEFKVYGAGTHQLKKSVRVKPHPETQHLEPFELRATQLALLEGKPAPEIPGVVAWKNSEPLELADLRGKCVLLDFWGYWCGPCVHGMPELFELYEKHHKDGLEIIGIHVDLGVDEEVKVDTVAELDKRLTETRKELWKGRDIPFPVALLSGNSVPFGEGLPGEARGLASARYGVIFYPTQLLIDRQGNVVGRFLGDEESIARLEQLLREK